MKYVTLRLFGVALLTLGVLLVVVWLLAFVLKIEGDVWPLVVVGLAFTSALYLSFKAFFPGEQTRVMFRQTDWAALGLLVYENYRARRAFEVEEFEDEGMTYFLELDDGRVLVLSGQYLYDTAEIIDDPDVNQSATFPNTDFTLERHRDEGWVHRIVCKGAYLKPEAVLSSFRPDEFEEFPDCSIHPGPYEAIMERLRHARYK